MTNTRWWLQLGLGVSDNRVSTTWRAVTVVVVAYDCDQYSVVVTVGFGGSLIITESVPPGGAVTVVVVAKD